jgi:3-phosphoshikimate 1-carboxyvinyltransferase
VGAEGGRFAVAPDSAYRRTELTIEGDWSSAGYLLTAAALLGREVTLSGLDPGSSQPDRAVLAILEQAAAEVVSDDTRVALCRGPSRPITADFAACPDLAPTVAALATALPGTSRLTGLNRLRDKESDRLAGLVAGLSALGIAVESPGDGVLVIRGGVLRPAEVDARNDHRLAMSFALLALCEPAIRVRGADAVGKSYPDFYLDLARL